MRVVKQRRVRHDPSHPSNPSERCFHWAGHSVADEPAGAVPGEVLLRRPVGRCCRESDFLVFHAGEQVRGFACLGEVPLGNENSVVVPECPEAVVEEPMSVLGEGDAFSEVFVAAVGELDVAEKPADAGFYSVILSVVCSSCRINSEILTDTTSQIISSSMPK